MNPDTKNQASDAANTNPTPEASIPPAEPPAPSAMPITQEAVVDKSHKKPWFSLNNKTAIILGALAVTILATTAAFLLLRKDSSTPSYTPAVEEKTSQAADAAKSVSGTSFLDKPKAVTGLDIISDYNRFAGESCPQNEPCKPILKSSDVKYYEIGTLESGNKLYGMAYNLGPVAEGSYLFTQSSSDKSFTVIGRHSTIYCLRPESTTDCGHDLDNIKKGFKSNVSVDTATTFPEFEFEKELTVKGQKLKVQGTGYFIGDGLGSLATDTKPEDFKKIDSVGNREFYIQTAKDEPNFSVHSFYATYKQIWGVSYAQNGEIAKNNGKLAYRWKNSEKGGETYFSAGAGCGSSAGFVVAKNINNSELVAAGTTPGSQTLYTLPVTAPLAKELFSDDYNGGGSDLQDASLRDMTIQQFTDKHSYFLVRNGLDQLMVYQRGDVFMRGGCGKPVIYLYPTKNTLVNVSVDADVKISEPTYPSGGWKNVLAKPNGQLTYNRKAYDSLYWEGYGHGAYPEIRSGTVVTNNQAASTIRSQLKQQGLNQKEIQDFMDFWQPRLPKTAYVRLTWLSQREIDTLAPLSITPKPQTSIRVFLDFEGLERPVALPTQKLVTPKRQGFTVVEWGGLLRDGLPL